MSDDLTPRERRAQQAGKRGRSGPDINWSKAVGPLVVLAILGLVFGMVYYNATKDETCPGHWHSSFQVHVFDERINFDLPQYKLAGENPQAKMPMSMHMHDGDQGQQIHWEPRPAKCMDFADFATLVDMEIGSGRLVLDGAHEQVGQGYALFNGDRNGTLAIYMSPGDRDDWQEISPSQLNRRQPKDGERTLVYFGDQGDTERVEQLQRNLPPPSQFRGGGPGHTN